PLPTEAKNFYQQAEAQYSNLANSGSATTRTKARLNRFRLISEGLVPTTSNMASQPIDITDLPAGRPRIYARIQIAKGQVCLSQRQAIVPDWLRLTKTVEQAVDDAKSLQDVRAQSYAFGNLAGLYEYRAWWIEQAAFKSSLKSDLNSWRQIALQLTDQALYLTQPGEFADLAYQWQWQRGRLLNAAGERSAATTAYEAAIKTLEAVRGDLLAINSDVQFSFRDNVEPVYRELVTLLLESQGNSSTSSLQQVLGESLFYVESLQLAELENFWQCNVETLGTVNFDRLNEQLDPPTALIDRIDQIFQNDPTTGLIYPILLKDRIALILKRPGESLQYYTTPVDHQTVEDTLTKLQAYLRDPSRTNAIRELSSQVYQWLIEPFEAELDVDRSRDISAIKNLVFVLDGSFRNIPMSMLYDQQRQRYLLERYSIAISSGLQLLDTSSQSKSIQALLGGLSEERAFGDQTFSALVNVPAELTSIQAVVPSENLLNADFNRDNLSSQLGSKAYSVVHMATHGNFSSDPENTFLVLSDQRLQASELNDLLRSPNSSDLIDLLVLSACETATGDKRAALGLAGLALRAGARSTLATLWQVNDASTAATMQEFYTVLNQNPDLTKAEALRQAQLSLWKSTSQDWEVPFFWAPYVLVGNWL
ncbi:MAG: CHAT domain-containing protein, partial [Symploca sp. SIO2G7]|nr:CHAT domain-containing protein [Symploca sp. SIO2G7]